MRMIATVTESYATEGNHTKYQY